MPSHVEKISSTHAPLEYTEEKDSKLNHPQGSSHNNSSANNDNRHKSNDTNSNARNAKKRFSLKKQPFKLGDRFFLLEWLHLWIFPLINQCRQQKDIKKIFIALANILTAETNGDNLDDMWKQEQDNAAAASR